MSPPPSTEKSLSDSSSKILAFLMSMFHPDIVLGITKAGKVSDTDSLFTIHIIYPNRTARMSYTEITSINRIAVHGAKKTPKTVPMLARAITSSKLCSQILGMKSHSNATTTAIPRAAATGRDKPRATNIPQPNRKRKMIFSTTFNASRGTRNRMTPITATATKK